MNETDELYELPRLGKVVIVDDKIEEIQDMLSVFSDNKIPHLVYTDRNLPSSPVENVRVLFLDIFLGHEGGPHDSHSVASTMIPYIMAIVGANNGPYICFLLSNNEDRNSIATALKSIFENAEGEMRKIQPIDFVVIPKNTPVMEIKSQIKATLREKQSIATLFYWEEKVGEAAQSVLNKLMEMSNSSGFEEANRWTGKLLKALATARCGLAGSEDALHKDAISVLNYLLADEVDRLVRELTGIRLDESEDLFDEEAKAKINRTLMCIDGANGAVLSEPGDISLITDDNIQSCNEKCLAFGDEALVGWAKKIARAPNSDVFIEWVQTAKKIWIEVSPPCDYYQDKQVMSRIIPGVLWPTKIKLNQNANGKFIYCSEFAIFDNEILEEPFYIVLNYRNFITLPKEILAGMNLPLTFRVRAEVLAQIRTLFSQHAMRIGLPNV